jgi:predicted Zn-dependent peptidase
VSIEISTLSNGLRVVTQHMPGLETAAVSLSIDSGSRFEDAPSNGVAHMLEHMVFKGTKRRTARAIAEEIEAVGGMLNAYTSRDQTVFYARVLADDVALGVDMVCDLITGAEISDADVEKEKEVVLQELGTALDTPDELVFDYLQEAAFPNQPLGRSILGTAETITALSAETIRAYQARNYVSGSMVLSAAGKINHSHFVKMAEEHLSPIPTGTRPSPIAAHYLGQEFHDIRELEQTHMTLALPASSFNSSHHYAEMLFSSVLGGGMSSRLFQDIREERGLAYSVYSYVSPYADGGLFGIYLGTGTDKAIHALSLTLDNLCACAEHITESEVLRAKAQAKAGLFMSLESCSNQAENLGRQLLVFDRLIPPAEIMAQIDACTAKDIADAGARILSAAPLAFSAVGPQLENVDVAALRARLQ